MTKKKQGFAVMSADKQREISSKGGRSVPAEKRSFSTNHALAQRAGRIGGLSVAPEKRSFSVDATLASKAGKKSGQQSRVAKQ